MTTIDFYFNATDRLQVACRLAGKAVAQQKRMLIYAPDAEIARKIDQMLWIFPPISFVPHCFTDDPLARETPVLIASHTEHANGSEILLNLGHDCPEFFARYERLLEIVSLEDEDRRAGRTRYAWYRDRGYAIRNHDLAGAGE